MTAPRKTKAKRAERSIVVRGIQSDAELCAANDLMAKTQAPDYWDCLDWLETCGPRWPGFTREHTRIALLDGAMAGALRILTATIRIGKARLKMGGLGWVSTSGEFRNQGVCAALVNESLDYMRAHGYAVSMLFGVPDLYHRYGYVCCIPEHSVRVPLSEAQRADSSAFHVAPFAPADTATVLALSERRDAELACSFVRTARYIEAQRSTKSRTTPLWPDWPATAILRDTRQRILGYFTPQDGQNELHVKELAVLDEAACPTVLRAVASVAEARGVATLRFHLPPDLLFSKYLKAYNSVHETQYFRDRQGMLRFVDLPFAMERMLPEWQMRIRASSFRTANAALALRVDEVSFTIDVRHGTVALVRTGGRNPVVLAGKDLVRACVGYSEPEDCLRSSNSRIGTKTRALFTVLFPKRVQCVWPVDHF